MGQRTFTFSDEMLSRLKKAVQDKINALNKAKEEIEAAIEREVSLLNELNEENISSTPSEETAPKKHIVKKRPPPYNSTWGWAAKASYILNQEKELLTLQQILNIADEDHGENLRADEDEYAKTKSNLAGQLKLNLNTKFMRIKLNDDVKYFYYGLREWFDEDGKPEEEYLPT